MAGKVKTWVWVVVAVVVLGILGIIAVAGAGIYFFSRHIQTRTVTQADRLPRLRPDRGPVFGPEAPDRAR